MSLPALRWCRWAAARCAFAVALALVVGGARGTSAAFTCGAADDSATCVALGELYAATGGAGWSNNAGWRDAAAGTATAACTFVGVYCDGGAVTLMCAPRAPCGQRAVRLIHSARLRR
jgi:hypothetical protein